MVLCIKLTQPLAPAFNTQHALALLLLYRLLRHTTRVVIGDVFIPILNHTTTYASAAIGTYVSTLRTHRLLLLLLWNHFATPHV